MAGVVGEVVGEGDAGADGWVEGGLIGVRVIHDDDVSDDDVEFKDAMKIKEAAWH